MITWEEVVKQILESNFNVSSIELPNGECKFDSLVNFKTRSENFQLLKSSNLDLKWSELSDLIKCLLIISPDKSERRPNGEPLTSKGHRLFNQDLLEKYRNNPVLSGLLSESFIKLLGGNWWWQEYSGKAAVQLSDYFVSDVLKDPRAIATWYSIKMPH